MIRHMRPMMTIQQFCNHWYITRQSYNDISRYLTGEYKIHTLHTWIQKFGLSHRCCKSWSGLLKTLIVSQESGQQYIAVLIFCPPSTFILHIVDINMEVSDRNHCVNKFVPAVKLCISIWGFMGVDSPPVQPQVAVQWTAVSCVPTLA